MSWITVALQESMPVALGSVLTGGFLLAQERVTRTRQEKESSSRQSEAQQVRRREAYIAISDSVVVLLDHYREVLDSASETENGAEEFVAGRTPAAAPLLTDLRVRWNRALLEFGDVVMTGRVSVMSALGVLDDLLRTGMASVYDGEQYLGESTATYFDVHGAYKQLEGAIDQHLAELGAMMAPS